MSLITKKPNSQPSTSTKSLPNKNWGNFWKTLGPGILFASSAIGVSHLVQSTRAGANYGFVMVIFIAMALFFKYPFFEFASRYSSATGKSIIAGYRQLGKGYLLMFFVLTLGTMFTVTAAVTFVTAGLLGHLLNLNIEPQWISAWVLILTISVLAIGKFKALDMMLKIVASILLISTLTAFFATLWQGPKPTIEGFQPLPLTSGESIVFIVALMGWMPTAVDLCSWNSVWTVERIKQTGYHPSLKETLFDFNLGYIISAILAICFLTLGAFLIFGTGSQLSDNTIIFAKQLVELYTSTIGEWIYIIISIAAFSTMFSTSVTVLDGYSRTMNETISLLFPRETNKQQNRNYIIVMCAVGIISFVVITFLSYSLSRLVTIATTFSFIIAPIIAVMNYQIITGKNMPKDFIPNNWLLWLAKAGIIFLTVFALIYLVVMIGG
jgi:Mn2+/Fe2+ NRAMP family transporter